jgi:peptidoglycan/xylan/chitin deacetylase (PgdA/CDA1 family)
MKVSISPSAARILAASGVSAVLGCAALFPFSLDAAGPNLISNPDLETTSSSGLPAGWLKGGYGTNTRTLTTVAGFQSAKAVRTQITSYTSGDAKWYFNPVSVSGGATLEFRNVFRSNTTSYVTAQFKMSDGTFRYQDIGTAQSSGGAWWTFGTTFTVPAGAVSISIFHLIKSVGFVETDRYFLGTADAAPTDPTKFDKGYVSINFDDGWLETYHNAYPVLNNAGFKTTAFIISERLTPNFPGYVKANDVIAMQNAGHEIGAHTRTHPDLTALSSSAAQSEIRGSRDDLFAIGATPLNFFAYPFGAYNSSVIQQVKDAGFKGARSSDGGYNLKNQDPYTLRRQPMVNVTTFANIKSFIDKARTDKTWVVLLFHQVDNSGAPYAVTPAVFNQMVDYLKQINMQPITLRDGTELMSQ